MFFFFFYRHTYVGHTFDGHICIINILLIGGNIHQQI